MECGFFHPERGYWQTITTPTPDQLAEYPKGTIEVPLKPSADHEWQNGAWVYVTPPELTPEEIRQNMPQLSMVDFRRKLRAIRTDTVTDGIYEEDILEKIGLIADKELAAEARDYFLYAKYIERINPWVENLGSMFGLTPEDIDVLWMADNEP